MKESCCDVGRAECTADLKGVCGVHKPACGKITPLFTGICDKDAAKAKDKLITIAMLNCQWATFLAIVMFVLTILTVKHLNIVNLIVATATQIIFPIFLIWGLRCCLNLQSKCWWTVYTIFQWVNIIQNLQIFLLPFSISMIIMVFYLIFTILLAVYSLWYCMGNSWAAEDLSPDGVANSV